MRCSLVLLVVLAACSDASGPRQVPVLTTQISSSVDSINGPELVVTLTASNPTDTTLQLFFTEPAVALDIKIGGQWLLGHSLTSGGEPAGSLSLTAGAAAPVGTVGAIFLPQAGSAPAMLPNAEYFS